MERVVSISGWFEQIQMETACGAADLGEVVMMSAIQYIVPQTAVMSLGELLNPMEWAHMIFGWLRWMRTEIACGAAPLEVGAEMLSIRFKKPPMVAISLEG